MIPTLYRSHDPFAAITREFDRWFGQESEPVTYPVDVTETKEEVVLEAELPGFTRDQIEVTSEGNTLRISAERSAKKAEGDEKATAHLRERRSLKVSRSFRFPNYVDTSKINAHLEHGVLTLRIAKRDEVKPRKIEVN